MYNYLENVKEDVKEYIKSEMEFKTIEDLENINQDKLYDDLFINDSVTGNASGSYTFNTWQAEENLCHNMELLKEALESFCSDINYLESPEACDVTIRCYLLGQAIDEAIEELKEEAGA